MTKKLTQRRLHVLKTCYLHFIYQQGTIGRAPGTKNDTKEDCNQDGSGTRRVLIPYFFFNNPDRDCYTQFFIHGQPPIGLRTGDKNLHFIKYICQPPTPYQQNQDTYFATMFDEFYGIAVFSAYTLTQATVILPQQHFNPAPWGPTPGNVFTCTATGFKFLPGA